MFVEFNHVVRGIATRSRRASSRVRLTGSEQFQNLCSDNGRSDSLIIRLKISCALLSKGVKERSITGRWVFRANRGTCPESDGLVPRVHRIVVIRSFGSGVAIIDLVLHFPDDVWVQVQVEHALLDSLLAEVATDSGKVEVADGGTIERSFDHVVSPRVLIQSFVLPVRVHDGDVLVVFVIDVSRNAVSTRLCLCPIGEAGK
mmetsp:Transcript_10371/g.37513  ORF Transcript_10371/g.37513 Transcript_10371/m.37513 type:complete len:202 (+) Transcript_10371:790-1395(+)